MRRFGFELIASEGLAGVKQDDRFKHLYCIGRSGSGKSTFLLNLIKQEFEHCCIVIDPAGNFAESVASLAPQDRLIYIDKKHPIKINPLNRPGLHWSEVANEFAEVMNACVSATSSSPESSVLMNELIRNAIRVLDGNNKSIERMADILNSAKVRRDYAEDKYWGSFDNLEPGVRQFEFREKRDSAKRVGARLSAFYDNEVMRPFTIGKNEFDVARFVSNKNVVVFNLSGFDNDAKMYLGNLAVSAVKSYYNHKQNVGGEPLYLYVDEFHRFEIPFWEEMLSQARKHNISINIAHQDHEQIKKSVLSSILGNVHTKVTFSCGHTEAQAMGNEYDFKPEMLKNLGKFEAYIRIGTKNHKVLTSPPPETPKRADRSFLSSDWITP